jgi:hypothetical protein
VRDGLLTAQGPLQERALHELADVPEDLPPWLCAALVEEDQVFQVG